MAQIQHLQSKFKKLRMSGMIDTLELRLQQAEQQRLGYLPFLELLLEDEIARRDQRGLALRIAHAHFEEVKTLEDFNFTFNPKIPAAKIRELATCRFVAAGESVLICGPVGTGKSHVSQSLGHAACCLGYKVLYQRASRLLAHLSGGRADGTWDRRFRTYLHPDLLIVDDFCVKELSAHQAEDIFELIGERHRSLSTIITSNRSPQDWYPLFPNPVLAESTLDRIINRSHHLILEGRSYRPFLRPDRQTMIDRESTPE